EYCCSVGACSRAGRGGIGMIERLELVAYDPQGRTVARGTGRWSDVEAEMLVDGRPSDQDGKKRNERERGVPEQPDEYENDIEEKKNRIGNPHKSKRPEHLRFHKWRQIA